MVSDPRGTGTQDNPSVNDKVRSVCPLDDSFSNHSSLALSTAEQVGHFCPFSRIFHLRVTGDSLVFIRGPPVDLLLCLVNFRANQQWHRWFAGCCSKSCRL
ncbi:hypothetical protein HAX54_002402 [Datura stramonium]|uniref:Uncharacterized protein n=1 Tax=Datura stramonium TaxID=4076 RepID=A0ABS8WVV3_DATST|nr:hypothetical protein [Datura stramonium]